MGARHESRPDSVSHICPLGSWDLLGVQPETQHLGRSWGGQGKWYQELVPPLGTQAEFNNLPQSRIFYLKYIIFKLYMYILCYIY